MFIHHLRGSPNVRAFNIIQFTSRSWLSLLLCAIGCRATANTASDGGLEIVLLHTNDMHSRFEQADIYGNMCTDRLTKAKLCYGGFARLKKAVTHFREEAAKENLTALFLNAGDTFQGTPYYTNFQWKIAAALVPKLGIDVMNLGNYEFNAGLEDLVAYLGKISIPVVTANANFSAEENFAEIKNLTPSKILQVDDTKIGIIGYILPLKKVGKITFTDEIKAIRKEALRLKAQNVSIIIGLGHSGFQRDIQIAEQVPEISLIVGGHSHSLLYTPIDEPPSVEEVTAPYPYTVIQKSGRKIPIVQAFCNTKYLGKIRVKFNKKSGEVVSAVGNPILLDHSFDEDEAVLKEVLKYKTNIKLLNKVVGRTTVLLSDRITPRVPECNFGNLITDAFVHYAVQNYAGDFGWTDAPIGILHGGSIRASIDRKEDEGIIRYSDVMTALPMDNGLVKVNVTGSTVVKALEFSVQTIRHDRSKFFIGNHLHLSGIKVIFDASKPVGQRVKSVLVRCGNCRIPTYKRLQTSQNYTIIISDYLFNSGDGFSMFADENIGHQTFKMPCRDVIASYMESQIVVYPEIEGRIRVENFSSLAVPRFIPYQIFFLLFLVHLFRNYFCRS